MTEEFLITRGWTPEGAKFLITKSDIPEIGVLFHRPLPREYPNKSVDGKVFIPSNLRWDTWERDNFTCQHCGIRRHLSIDHIIPESKGGTLDLENLQTLCMPCNRKKGDS